MNGSGTSSDPYIITNADELYSMSGSSNYYALGSDIDLNGTPYADSYTAIPLSCAGLDGRGHTIRNIFTSKPSSDIYIFNISKGANYIDVIDLIVENVQATGLSVNLFGGSSGTVYVTGCTFGLSFSLLSDSDYTKSILGRSATIKAKYCTFLIRVAWRTPGTIIYGGSLIGCQFVFDIISTKFAEAVNKCNPMFYSTELADCSFTGTICTNDSDKWITLTRSVKMSNCYAVITGRGGNMHILFGDSYDTIGASCAFYDKDVTGTAQISTLQANYVKGLTTAQCKDAAYLRSIGFICEGE